MDDLILCGLYITGLCVFFAVVGACQDDELRARIRNRLFPDPDEETRQ